MFFPHIPKGKHLGIFNLDFLSNRLTKKMGMLDAWLVGWSAGWPVGWLVGWVLRCSRDVRDAQGCSRIQESSGMQGCSGILRDPHESSGILLNSQGYWKRCIFAQTPDHPPLVAILVIIMLFFRLLPHPLSNTPLPAALCPTLLFLQPSFQHSSSCNPLSNTYPIKRVR